MTDQSLIQLDEAWIEVPAALRQAFEQNPLRALRDLGAFPSSAKDPWDPQGQSRWGQANPDRQHPHGETGCVVDGVVYYFSSDLRCMDREPRWIHVDLALARDACGLAMAHAKPFWINFVTPGGALERRPFVVVDLMLQVKAPPGGHIIFNSIRDRIRELRARGFDIAGISYDGWQSIDSQQILAEEGFHTEELSVDRTLVPYECLLEYMNTGGALDYYYYPPFLKEWQALSLVDGRKVDHPPGGSKDVADAVAGAVYMASTKLLNAGTAALI